ncbi:hypothetical protein JL721_2175 [Aureococcus anophagefferens]|nr:hypothetical protein JL721_2175 [Aureococcus anophagefferens]
MTEKSMASRAPAAAVTRPVALVGRSPVRGRGVIGDQKELTSRNDEPVQVAIRVYVERLLTMKALKPNLRITTDSKARCYAKNALQFDRFKGFPWWSHNAWPSHDGDDGHCAGLARTATKAMAAF